MNRLLLILILTFSFQTFSKADDIRDFEIEGISVGDSLLDFYSEENILDSQTTIFPGDKMFYDIHIPLDSDSYDQITYTVKSNDKKYIIEQIAGDNYYYTNEGKNIDTQHLACVKQKKIITKEFEKILNVVKKNEYKSEYSSIDDGKSFAEVVDFKFNDGSSIRIYCNKFTNETIEKRLFFNGLTVSISPIKVLDWLNSKAYK